MSKKRRKPNKNRPIAGAQTPRPHTTPASTPAPIQIEAAPMAEAGFGEDLLEKCRTRWQYGNWEDLISSTQEEISAATGRDKVAILVAAGHAQVGDMPRARHFANLALSWGVSRDIAARVLLGSAQNSLACAATALGLSDDAEIHFHDSVNLVEPRADSALLTHNRRFRETARLGLLSEASSLLEIELRDLKRVDGSVPGHADPQARQLANNLAWLRDKSETDVAALPDVAPVVCTPLAAPTPEVLAAPNFSIDAFNYYREKDSGFLYLDIKSLPRSGLHYTKTCLEDIVGNNFSFCERYQEPGCCGKMPCVLTGFDKPSEFGIRMIKSHDFDINDPAFPTGEAVRRLVLLRDPLMILTSWWVLEVLQANKDMLSQRGIDVLKIFYLHEPGVVSSAHNLVVQHGQFPEAQVLSDWLDKQGQYINRFIDKWGNDEGATLVNFATLPQTLSDLLLPWHHFMPAQMEKRLAQFVETSTAAFKPRYSPWVGPNDTYSAYLEKHAHIFERAVEKIRRNDTRGFLPSEG